MGFADNAPSAACSARKRKRCRTCFPVSLDTTLSLLKKGGSPKLAHIVKKHMSESRGNTASVTKLRRNFASSNTSSHVYGTLHPFASNRYALLPAILTF